MGVYIGVLIVIASSYKDSPRSFNSILESLAEAVSTLAGVNHHRTLVSKEFVRRVVERYDGDGYEDMPGLRAGIKYWEASNGPTHIPCLGNC